MKFQIIVLSLLVVSRTQFPSLTETLDFRVDSLYSPTCGTADQFTSAEESVNYWIVFLSKDSVELQQEKVDLNHAENDFIEATDMTNEFNRGVSLVEILKQGKKSKQRVEESIKRKEKTNLNELNSNISNQKTIENEKKLEENIVNMMDTIQDQINTAIDIEDLTTKKYEILKQLNQQKSDIEIYSNLCKFDKEKQPVQMVQKNFLSSEWNTLKQSINEQLKQDDVQQNDQQETKASYVETNQEEENSLALADYNISPNITVEYQNAGEYNKNVENVLEQIRNAYPSAVVNINLTVINNYGPTQEDRKVQDVLLRAIEAESQKPSCCCGGCDNQATDTSKHEIVVVVEDEGEEGGPECQQTNETAPFIPGVKSPDEIVVVVDEGEEELPQGSAPQTEEGEEEAEETEEKQESEEEESQSTEEIKSEEEEESAEEEQVQATQKLEHKSIKLEDEEVVDKLEYRSIKLEDEVVDKFEYRSIKLEDIEEPSLGTQSSGQEESTTEGGDTEQVTSEGDTDQVDSEGKGDEESSSAEEVEQSEGEQKKSDEEEESSLKEEEEENYSIKIEDEEEEDFQFDVLEGSDQETQTEDSGETPTSDGQENSSIKIEDEDQEKLQYRSIKLEDIGGPEAQNTTKVEEELQVGWTVEYNFDFGEDEGDMIIDHTIKYNRGNEASLSQKSEYDSEFRITYFDNNGEKQQKVFNYTISEAIKINEKNAHLSSEFKIFGNGQQVSSKEFEYTFNLSTKQSNSFKKQYSFYFEFETSDGKTEKFEVTLKTQSYVDRKKKIITTEYAFNVKIKGETQEEFNVDYDYGYGFDFDFNTTEEETFEFGEWSTSTSEESSYEFDISSSGSFSGETGETQSSEFQTEFSIVNDGQENEYNVSISQEATKTSDGAVVSGNFNISQGGETQLSFDFNQSSNYSSSSSQTQSGTITVTDESGETTETEVTVTQEISWESETEYSVEYEVEFDETTEFEFEFGTIDEIQDESDLKLKTQQKQQKVSKLTKDLSKNELTHQSYGKKDDNKKNPQTLIKTQANTQQKTSDTPLKQKNNKNKKNQSVEKSAQQTTSVKTDPLPQVSDQKLVEKESSLVQVDNLRKSKNYENENQSLLTTLYNQMSGYLRKLSSNKE